MNILSNSANDAKNAMEYSKEFRELIVKLHRGKENWPNYEKYLMAHLGGPDSRLFVFTHRLCPEIEYHCGSLKEQRILDFGCGTGASTVALAQYSGDVCALDMDKESIGICEQRVREHGMEERIKVLSGEDIEVIKGSIGTFNIILLNGVIEHIPISKSGLREKILRSLFGILKEPGYMVIHDTPNRLYPFDYHSTQLWGIPWTRPGSIWAYKRAVAKGRHSNAPTISEGPLGLEEVGAWGATYWEILNYLKGESFICVNTLDGHNRHIHYSTRGSWKRRAFEFVAYHSAVKLLHVPITALAPSLSNLVIKKLN